MKTTTQHPLKQKWKVPIDNVGKFIRLKWVKLSVFITKGGNGGNIFLCFHDPDGMPQNPACHQGLYCLSSKSFIPRNLNSFNAASNFCCLLITLVNSLGSDQDQHNVSPDLLKRTHLDVSFCVPKTYVLVEI